MKMTNTRADPGDDEGIVICHDLLFSRISRFFLEDKQADEINTTKLTFFFFSSIVELSNFRL